MWMKLEYIGIGIRYIGIYCIYLCVGLTMCAIGICIEILPLGNFHGDLYSHEITCFRGGVLLRNTIFSVCLWYSHEINFTRVTLTKSISRWWLSWNTELPRNQFMMVISWNSTKYRQENTDANLVATLFSWGWLSRTPAMKRIRGGELSWKWDFRVSIIVRVDAWRCTLMHYFRESKTIFRDVFCTLTKSLDSGSEQQQEQQSLSIPNWLR
jgi:hypothetical protein